MTRIELGAGFEAGRKPNPSIRSAIRRLATRLCTAGLLAGAVSCASTPPPAHTAMHDAVFGGERHSEALRALAARAQLAPGQQIAVRALGRDAHSSHHLVTIRDREPLHRHDRHDLLVVMLRGHGAMHQAGAESAVGEGSILFVPRGTVHAFRNESGEPAVAYAVYWPPFDGKDRVLTAE